MAYFSLNKDSVIYNLGNTLPRKCGFFLIPAFTRPWWSQVLSSTFLRAQENKFSTINQELWRPWLSLRGKVLIKAVCLSAHRGQVGIVPTSQLGVLVQIIFPHLEDEYGTSIWGSYTLDHVCYPGISVLKS